jgi:hypothetical protein
VALPPVPEAVTVVLACWAVPPVEGDVEACTGDRGNARPDRVVPPALEPGRMVLPGRYRSLLEPVDGSALSTSD